MNRLLFIFCTLSLAALCACDNSKTTAPAEEVSAFSLDSVKAQIAASNLAFGECFAKNDSAAFVQCYTSDGCIYPPAMPPLCGREAIGGFFRGGYQQGLRQIRLTTNEVMGGKDGVIETGVYEAFAENNVSVEKGKFIVIWKEENGKWKMHRDIWNYDPPAPATK